MAGVMEMINLIFYFLAVLFLEYVRGTDYGGTSGFFTSTFGYDPEDVDPLTSFATKDATEEVTSDLQSEVTRNDTVKMHFDSAFSPVGPPRDPLYVIVPVTIIYGTAFSCGVSGNVVTCVVIKRHRNMHTSTNYYLISMAVSDILLLVSGLPQQVYYIWSDYPYIFGEPFCIVRGVVAETAAHATVLTITAFTAERYLAICHPFLSHSITNVTRALRLIIVIWLLAFGFAIPSAAQLGVVTFGSPEHTSCTIKRIIFKHYFELLMVIFFVVPLITISVLYIFIGARVRQIDRMERVQGNPEDGFVAIEIDASGQRRYIIGRSNTNQSSARVVKMLVCVVVAFFVCWAPFHAQRLVTMYVTNIEDSPKIYSTITYVSGILFYLSTTINPILYHIMSNRFREAFKELTADYCRTNQQRPQSSTMRRSRPSQRRAESSSCELSTLLRRNKEPMWRRRFERPTSSAISIPLQTINPPSLPPPSIATQRRLVRSYQAWIEAGSRTETGRAVGRRENNVMFMIANAPSSAVLTATGGYFSIPSQWGRIGTLSAQRALPAEGMVAETSFVELPGRSKDRKFKRLEVVKEEPEDMEEETQL